MMPRTRWDDIIEWFAHLPVALAYRMIWAAARLNLGSARMVYRAMWNANLDLPVLRDSDEHRNGEDPEEGLSGEAMPARAEGIAKGQPS